MGGATVAKNKGAKKRPGADGKNRKRAEKSGAARPRAARDGYIPFAVRFKAWWEGVDPADLLEPSGKAKDDAGKIVIDGDAPEETGRWPESRRALCSRIWAKMENDEVVGPGGSDYSVELAKPMSLNEKKSAIDLGAGLGGGTRRLNGVLGVWVTGYELDEELAGHANELSRMHGQERRAPVHHLDEENFELPEKKADGILLRERFYRVRNKPKFLDTVFEGLKPRGHLIMTDFVLTDEAAAADPLVEKWLAIEAQVHEQSEEPPLWTKADFKKALLEKRLDLRIFEDETDKFAGLIREGWAQFVEGLEKSEMTRTFVDNMMREAEYWLILNKVLESGKVRYIRIHGIRGGETL